jgi:hypothetical protein
MKVYRISTFATPPGTKFRYYAQLAGKKSDKEILSDDNFQGRPFPKKWRRIELFFDEPLWPRADFYHLGLGNFVCNERVKTLLGSLMDSCGEFLPVTIEGEKGCHYIYNVTKCEACVDPIASIWECDRGEKHQLENPTSLCIMAEPAFDIQKIRNGGVFKIPKRTNIYCVEQTGNVADQEFKALVEHHKLIGIRFELAWSEHEGVVPKRNPPMKESPFVWVTGDGKKYKATKGK